MGRDLVGGLDVCRGGWTLALIPVEPGFHALAPPSIHLVERFDEVIEMLDDGELLQVAVDIPIGLPDRGRRACDVEARALIGSRRASVFSAPIRPLLGTRTHAEANARSIGLDGRGISMQAFNLFERIIEVDKLMVTGRQEQVCEAHPEVVFRRLKGEPLEHAKRRTPGRVERLELLKPEFGDLRNLSHPRGMAGDDVLDAIAAALAARAVVDGEPFVLGDGARDIRGLAMEMVSP